MVTTVSASRTHWLSQLGLSICATVAATLLVTGIEHELAWLRAEPVRPVADMTSGGKFAARVEAMRASAEGPAILPPPVPLLAADATLQALPASFSPATSPALADIGKSVKRTAHADVHRRAPAETAHDVLPPRRSDHVIEVAAANATPAMVADGDDTTLWSTTKGVYRQAIALGGTALDRINPLNLVR